MTTIHQPTLRECMRYSGGYGFGSGGQKTAAVFHQVWDPTATVAPLALWLRASHPSDAGDFMYRPDGTHVEEWDDVVASTHRYMGTLDSGVASPQYLEDGGYGQPAIRFAGAQGLRFDGNSDDYAGVRALPVEALPTTPGATVSRTFTLAMVARLPDAGATGAPIIGHFAPNQGNATTMANVQGYGWFTNPADITGQPVFHIYPGADTTPPTNAFAVQARSYAMKAGTRALFVQTGSVFASGPDPSNPSGYAVASRGGGSPYDAGSPIQNGIVYADDSFFRIGGPGVGGKFATFDIYESWMWLGDLSTLEFNLLTSYWSANYT